MIKISVITVCYNADHTIEETIKSVISQSYKHIEYIIIDGNSQDDTLSIISQYISYNIKLISENDNGVYDAMNKGIFVANGDYIIFMNSGDCFVTDDTIEKMVSNFENDYDILYGNSIILQNRKSVIKKYTNSSFKLFAYLLSGNMICHQAMFVKKELLLNNPFDVNYKICADKDFLIKMIKNKKNLHWVDINVVLYNGIDGISSSVSNQDRIREETDMIIKCYYPFWFFLLLPIKTIIRFLKRVSY